MREERKLKEQVEREARRLKQAEREQPTLLAQTAYLGTLGVVLVLPIVAGAYLGSWLDRRLPGYSVNWTISLIIVGLFIGATNVYLMIRNRE